MKTLKSEAKHLRALLFHLLQHGTLDGDLNQTFKSRKTQICFLVAVLSGTLTSVTGVAGLTPGLHC